MDVIVLQPLAWSIRRWGVQTILALCLVIIALSSVALGLADLIRGLDGGSLLAVVFFGVILGWLLAKSPLPEWLALSLAIALGAELAVYQTGRLGTSLRALTASAIDLIQDVMHWPTGGSSPDVALLTQSLGELGTDVNSTLSHVYDWAQRVIRGEAAIDPIAVGLLWGLGLVHGGRLGGLGGASPPSTPRRLGPSGRAASDQLVLYLWLASLSVGSRWFGAVVDGGHRTNCS